MPGADQLPLDYYSMRIYRAVVNATCHAGHTLLHSSFFQFLVKSPIRILKSPIAVKQWVSIRIGRDSLVEGLINQRIVIAVADHIGYNTPVIEIQYGAEIDLVNFHTVIPF